MTDTARVNILNALRELKLRNTVILDHTCDLVINNEIKNISAITNILYVMAQLRYVPNKKSTNEGEGVIDKYADITNS